MMTLLLVPATRWILLALVITVVAVTWRILSQNSVQAKYQKMRKSNEQRKPVFVRRTDLMKLSPNQERDRKRAYDLIQRGQISEGARLLEGVNLQREAVTVLEESGLINEACAVLMRLNRPNRAAAVFARHGMYVQAAEQYLAAGCPDDAALQFLEAAKTAPECFERAGKIYESISKPQQALKAFITGKSIEKVIALAFTLEDWDSLSEFMIDRSNAKKILSQATSAQIKQLIDRMTIDQRTVPLLAQWSDLHRKTEFLAAILRRLSGNLPALSSYWLQLPQELAAQLCSALCKSVTPGSKEGAAFLTQNGHALYNARLFALAGGIYSVAERHAMAGRCFALAGLLDHCFASLRKCGDEHLVQKYQEAILAFKTIHETPKSADGKWHPEAIAAVCRALENVDPDSDEVATRSPFSMVA